MQIKKDFLPILVMIYLKRNERILKKLWQNMFNDILIFHYFFNLLTTLIESNIYL
jgi:hypothetical protein